MLPIPTPFPLVGSYALYEQDGRTHLVRIQRRDEAGEATRVLISFPGRWGSTGNTLVPLADMQDGTPLTDAERREYVALESALAGTSASTRSKRYRRYMALRQRDLTADLLAEQMRRAGVAQVAA